MPKLSPERKEFLHGVFTTALEGGIGYWSQASKYRWSQGDEAQTEDLDGFIAVVHPLNDDESGYVKKGLTVNRAVIQRGLRLIGDRAEKCTVRDDIYRNIVAADRSNGEQGDMDAECADCIVQAGLFGEIIYG
jgi:hypothetical protein